MELQVSALPRGVVVVFDMVCIVLDRNARHRIAMSRINDVPNPSHAFHRSAGVAAAWSLSRFPEKFQVELWEALPEIGGVASTCPLGDGSNDEINDQVQGGAPSYRNNLLLLQQAGVETTPVDFKIAFGTGEHAWSNHGEPSDMVKRLGRYCCVVVFWMMIIIYLFHSIANDNNAYTHA